MARSLLAAICFWLGIFEWLAERRGWWGLAWRRGGRGAPPALLAGAALCVQLGGRGLLKRVGSRQSAVRSPQSAVAVHAWGNRHEQRRTNVDKAPDVRARPRSSASYPQKAEQLRSTVDSRQSAVPRVTADWPHRLLTLALAAPLALGIQLVASSLRGRRLDPMRRLRPGPHADRRVTDLRIPMHEGYLPAILLEPIDAYPDPSAVGRPLSAVDRVTADGQRPTATAVCVLHGSGDHKAAYTWWLADALLAQGIAALLIDLDGHGENPRAQFFPTITEDVRVAVGWLRGRYARVGLLGLSLGGCVAARAVADGVPADALVVMEAPPRLAFSRADMRREALALLNPHALAMFQDCTAYQLACAWPSAPIRAAISTWDLIDALDLLGSLPRIQAPLLLLYGASDAIVKPAQATQVCAAAPAHAEFHLVPGASHLTLFVRRDIQAQVAAWLAQKLGEGEEMTR